MSDINDTQENNAAYFDNDDCDHDDDYSVDEYDYVSEEEMFANGYVGDDYEGEYDFLDDEIPVAPLKVKSPMMTKYPMAVKISARDANSFPNERYLFVSDGYCILNMEAWPLVTVKNGTVSTMRMSAQDTLYYFPDYDDQKRYMDNQRIVVKKEDMLRDSRPSRNLDDDDIPF